MAFVSVLVLGVALGAALSKLHLDVSVRKSGPNGDLQVNVRSNPRDDRSAGVAAPAP